MFNLPVDVGMNTLCEVGIFKIYINFTRIIWGTLYRVSIVCRYGLVETFLNCFITESILICQLV